MTVALDTTPPVLGVGDHRSKRDAERLAALSALYQLYDSGLVCEYIRTIKLFYNRI